MAEGDSELAELYQEVLMDYSRSAAHKGRAEPAHLRARGINPVCGDEIELTMSMEGPRIGRLRYDGHGCVISQASAAMMAEALEGTSREEARALAEAFKEMLVASPAPEAVPEPLEAARALSGVRKFPLRVKCATLAWNTLLAGLAAPGAAAQDYQEVE